MKNELMDADFDKGDILDMKKTEERSGRHVYQSRGRRKGLNVFC
jgi:hypothetical protein